MIKKSDFPATVYKLLKYLIEEELFEDIVVFERPRTIHEKDVESSLERLKWAAKNREFWFMGPFDWIRFQCKLGTLEGTLFVGKEVMVFKTLVKVGEVEKLLSMFEQQGIEVDVQEVGHFTAELSIWDKKSFSLQNVMEFIAKLKKTLAKRKPKSPR
jgi:hypothetical protein